MGAERFKLDDSELLQTKGFINGKWCSAKSSSSTKGAAEPFSVVDPATGKEWTKCETMGRQDVDEAVVAAKAAFPAFAQSLPRDRARKLLEFDRLLRLAKADVAQLIVMETGKALCEAEAEMEYALSYSFFFIGEPERMSGETVRGASGPNARFFTIRQPIGVVGLLCPWNFPVVIAVRKMCAALAAGCTVVIKPSPESPCSTLALALLAQRAGFSDGVVNVVTASHDSTPEVGARLCEHPDVKKISFTGSTPVGKLLMRQCSTTLKKLTLELGGNGGWAIFDDADVEAATDALLANKFRNAGQVCVTANRIFVHISLMDKVSALMKQKIATLRVGHGLDPGITMGAMTTQRGCERAEKLVKDAASLGSEVVVGGKRFGSGYHFEPTLIVGAGLDSPVCTEELFAPILSVYPFETDDQVVKMINDTTMGLNNYIWTRNISRAWRLFEQLESGTVAINTGSANVAEAPFGGIKESGMGKEGGIKYAVDEFCIVKGAALSL